MIELEFAFIQWHENAYRMICVSSGLARFFMSQSEKWDISTCQINYYCTEDRILGAVKMAGVWLIPKTAGKPHDRRRKDEK